MTKVTTSIAILLLFSMLSVAPSPLHKYDRVPSALPPRRLPQEGYSLGNRKAMKRFAEMGHLGTENKAPVPVPIAEKGCLTDNCPTKKTGSNFVNDYYDVNPNVNERAEKADSDYQASVLDGGNGAQSRKTKVFEADYVHLGIQNSRSKASKNTTCPGCRILNIVISDITGGKSKVLSDIKYTL